MVCINIVDARLGATHRMGDAIAAVAADASNATPTTLQEGTSVAVAAIAGDLAACGLRSLAAV
jgi:hypothetical protein